MSRLKKFRALARYNVLTSVAVLGVVAAGGAVAADKVNNVTIGGDTVDNGSGYVNNGTINGLLSDTGGDVTTVVNNGTIRRSGDAVYFNNNVANFVNAGTILTDTNNTAFTVDVGMGESSTLVNTGSIIQTGTGGGGAINRFGSGNFTIINSGVIRGRNTMSLSGGNDTLVLKTGSELYAATGQQHAIFSGGNDTLDFSGFYGTAVIRTEDFNYAPGSGDTVVAGDRPYIVMAGNAGVTIFDQTGAASMGSVTSGSLGSIQTAIANELGGFSAGDVFDPSAVSGYAAEPRQTSAAKAADAAVLSDLDVSEPSKGKVWGTVFGGVTGDSAPVALSNVYGGIVVGTHFQLDAQTRLGGLVGYSMSKFNVANGQQVIDSQTGTLGVYGMTDLGMIELNYALLGGGSSHSSIRQVVVGANKENATASFASWFINPSLGLAIPVMSDDTTTVKLAASASYIYGGVGSYTESSANFTANVGAMPISVFEARLELNGEKIIAPTAHGDVRIRGKIGLLAEANMGSSNIPLTLNGTATTFANPGTTTFGAYAGAGLSADIGSGLVLDSGVDLTVRADGNNAASGKVSLIGSF